MKGVQRHTVGIYTHLIGRQLNLQRSTRTFNLTSSLIVPRRIESQNFRNLCTSSNVCFSSALETKAQVIVDVESSGARIKDAPNIDQVGKGSATSTTKTAKDKVDITDVQDVESLLQASATPHSLTHSCQILLALGQAVQSSSESTSRSEVDKIVNDERFKNMCSTLENANFQHNPHNLLNALQGLYNMGLTEENNHSVKLLENELKWAVRRCPTKYLARAIEILSSQTGRGGVNNIKKMQQAKLSSNNPLVVASETLQRRWVEVTTGTDFIAAFRVISSLKDETRLKLEDRAVEMVQDFSPVEIIKIFIALGNQKRRATPLLRALAFHLSKNKEKLLPKDLIELIFALNELTFADPILMAKICNDLHPEIASITSPPLISTLAKSLGQLRYKHAELLHALDEWIAGHLSQLRPFDCATWLLTSSVLNIQSENTAKFCSQAKQMLTKESSTPSSWINVVHALVILNQADSPVISSILEPSFVAKLDSDDPKLNMAKLKLLQVHGKSKNLKGYAGPYLSNEIVSKWTPIVVKCLDEKLSKSVFETLGNFLPPPKYLNGSQSFPYGVFVDASCTLNDKLDPVPISSIAADKQAKIIRVAIVVQGYPSICLGIKEPTGHSCLATQLLQEDGYYVVTVPYMEFSLQEKLLRRVQYLEQKIRSINLRDGGTVSSQSSGDNTKLSR